MEKRLFFGMQAHCPWPEDFPFGRLLDGNNRHMTLAFLGKADLEKMQAALSSFPLPNFKVGCAAKFDQCLFLPPRHPRVVAWHIEWLEKNDKIHSYYQRVGTWLQDNGFQPDTRHDFTPHVTLARSPFNEKKWSKSFIPLPAFIQDIHLYESLGNLEYAPRWTHSLLPPFKELDHTADIAYVIYGDTYNQLFIHALLALCFNFPQALTFFPEAIQCNCLEDVIIELNHVVAQVDQAVGSPFKAVSFHSRLNMIENVMQWEMIIDV